MKKQEKKKRNRARNGRAQSVPIIVKRGSHAEGYDERKVYASVYFSCRNAHLQEIKSERIAGKVASVITRIAKKERVILSDRVHHLIAEELAKHDKDAAFLYQTHRDLS